MRKISRKWRCCEKKKERKKERKKEKIKKEGKKTNYFKRMTEVKS